MAAALVLPVSGAYTATWNTRTLGTQNDDGYVLTGSYTGQEVNATDLYGMTLVEAIYRGINWRMRFRGMEFNRPGMLSAIQAFGSVMDPATTFTPALTTQTEYIGDRYSKYSQALVLTAILTGATPTMPQTLTAMSAIVAPQSNVEYLMTSKVREAPFEMVLLPYNTSIGTITLVQTAFTTA